MLSAILAAEERNNPFLNGTYVPVSYTHLARSLAENAEHALTVQRHFRPVSYTHLDVYKRQVPKYVLSGKGCGISKTTRMLAQKQPHIKRVRNSSLV